MTRGRGVGGQAAADGAGGARPAHPSGQPAVGAGLAGGDAQRLLQHSAAEAGDAGPVDADAIGVAAALGEGADALRELAEAGVGGGLGGAQLQDFAEGGGAGGAGEGGGAEAARRGDEADPAEGGLAEVERKDRGREGRSSFES